MEEKPISLQDVKRRNSESRRDQLIRMLTEHPELAEHAIIVAPKYGITLAPEGMRSGEVVGLLEKAKFSILLQESMETITT